MSKKVLLFTLLLAGFIGFSCSKKKKYGDVSAAIIKTETMLTNTDTSTGGSSDSSPTALAILYYNSSDAPIGGVQNAYRLSGASVSWGQKMDGGLGLYPKKIDNETVSFGEPEGSISLANWFKSFKRSTHTGTYTYAKSGGTAESSYKATKL